MPRKILVKSILCGVLALLLLVIFYFLIVTLLSGWNLARGQFLDYWYYLLSLAAGFGIQIGLYTYLKGAAVSGQGSGKVMAVSGTTSGTAMISCCAHYLANIAPMLATSGALTVMAQYQVQLFWVGLIFNLGGIIFVTNKLFKYKKLYGKS